MRKNGATRAVISMCAHTQYLSVSARPRCCRPECKEPETFLCFCCAMAVTMASAKKVRRQKILKIFLPECSCQTERAAVRSPVRVSRLSTEMLFVYREIVYGELSAPMRYNQQLSEINVCLSY